MMQGMIANEADCIVVTKVQSKRTHAAEEAIVNMLKTEYLAAADRIKDASI